MKPYILSTQQWTIVNTSKTLVNVTYNNADVACQTISMRVVRNISEKKSTLLIVPDRMFEQKIRSSLMTLSLEDHTLSVNLKNSVTENDLNVLREKCTLKPKNENLNVYEKNPPFVNILNEKISGYYYDCRHTKVWNKKTWREILDNYTNKVNNEDSEILQSLLDELSLDFSETEFDTISQYIIDAIYIYRPDFEINELYKTNNKLSARKNQDDDFQNISYELFKLKDQALNLGERYGNVIKNIERLFIKTAYQYVSDTLDQIKILSHEVDRLILSAENQSGYFSGFSAISKERVKNIKILVENINYLADQLTNKKIIQTQTTIKNIEEAHVFLDLLTKAINDWKLKIPETKLDFFRSVNKLNYHDPLLEDIEKDATNLVSNINDSGIFSRRFELNTLSIKKQHEYIFELIYELEVMMLNIQKNIPYYQWLTFLDEIDEKSRKIIRSLKIFDPSVWMSLFDVWYHARLLEQCRNFTDINDEIFEKYLDCQIKSEKTAILNAKIQQENNIETTIKSLKKEYPELYNVLIKKKNTKHPELWKHFLTENNTVLKKLYPIIIIDADEITEMNSGSFDELICVDVPQINPDILQKFGSLISFYHQDEKVITSDFHLTGEENISFTPLQEIHTTGRISLVRNITNEMLQFGISPSVYRIKNAAIISFGSTYINECLSAYFYKYGIKKMDGDQSIQEIIIGSLLDSDMVAYVLIEDYLINPSTQFSDFLHQRESIKNLQAAGCVVLNLDTALLFETKGLNMSALFDQIKSDQLSEEVIKKQLSIEFH